MAGAFAIETGRFWSGAGNPAKPAWQLKSGFFSGLLLLALPFEAADRIG
jgi:hypothetical protein